MITSYIDHFEIGRIYNAYYSTDNKVLRNRSDMIYSFDIRLSKSVKNRIFC